METGAIARTSPATRPAVREAVRYLTVIPNKSIDRIDENMERAEYPQSGLTNRSSRYPIHRNIK
jgi:hypothetical protein